MHSKKRKRILIICFTLIVIFSGVYIITTQFRDNIIFFYSPSEFSSLENKNKIVRVGGLVVEGSIKKLEDDMTTEFIITDLSQEMKIRYSGLLPALFRENQGMVAKGTVNAQGIFIANQLLAKHDENYMPPEVAKSLKKSGNYKAN
jgi:cytochrome c-type biogenesis protein CcmE